MLTDDAFGGMIELASYYTSVRGRARRHGVPWYITQLGGPCRVPVLRCCRRVTGSSALAADAELDEYMHLYTVNRGVLMTPFHNMALMCPATAKADVDTHTEVFAAAVAELAFGQVRPRDSSHWAARRADARDSQASCTISASSA